MTMTRELKIAALLYLICTGVYAITAWDRLLRPSSDTHFVWMADTWLHRRLDLGRSPPHTNDWAEIEYLRLKDGTQVAGAFQRQVSGRFRTLSGQLRNIAESEIASRERKYYVSFPPMPALLMLPFVAIFGFRTNDVVFNVVLAGLVPALFFLVLRRIRRLGPEPGAGEHDSAGGPPPSPAAPDRDMNRAALAPDLWLCGVLAFGCVFYFSAVIGQVWYTAHVVSLVLAALFLLCVLPLRRPALAGLCLGALMLTRPQMVFFGVLLLYQALAPSWRERRFTSALRPAIRPLVVAALPFLALSAAGFAHNYVRFGNPLEFGHSYLTTMQADNIQRYGLFNYQYLSRNLACALTLLPKLLPRSPYIQVSYHGLSLLLTTPILLYLLWPAPDAGRRALRRALWVAIVPIALLGLLYQNDGYIQFGFRFSLDYMLLLLLLVALGNQAAIPTRTFRALALCGVVVNLFGAITFGRMWQFYFNSFFPVA